MKSLGMSATALMAASLVKQPAFHHHRVGPGVRNPLEGQQYDRRGRPMILANLSSWHPDYGMTPAQHAEEKAKRAAGKVKFIDKAALKARRLGLARSYGL